MQTSMAGTSVPAAMLMCQAWFVMRRDNVVAGLHKAVREMPSSSCWMKCYPLL